LSDGKLSSEPIAREEIPPEIGRELGAIFGIAFPRQGHTSDVGIIESEKGLFVLKRAKGEQYASWLAREAFVLDGLERTSLRIPKAYRFVQSEDDKGSLQSWLLMERLEGNPLRQVLRAEQDPVVRHGLISRFGASLRELHSTPCPEPFKSGESWLEERLEQAEYNLRHYETDGTWELLERLKSNKPKPFSQTLIHGDCTLDNVLAHEGNVTGFIDWSGGAYGDPRYDVALAIRPKPDIFGSASDLQAFFDGYGDRIISEEEYTYFENGLYAFF